MPTMVITAVLTTANDRRPWFAPRRGVAFVCADRCENEGKDQTLEQAAADREACVTIVGSWHKYSSGLMPEKKHTEQHAAENRHHQKPTASRAKKLETSNAEVGAGRE